MTPDDGNGLPVASRARAGQVRAVDVTRFVSRLGCQEPTRFAQLDRALRLHLDLEE